MPTLVTTFDKMVERVLDREGGYVNNPKDPGGETKFGISKRSYPKVDIKNLTWFEAKGIYKRDFWDRVRGDKLYDGTAFQLFDFAVNSGVSTAIREVQRAIQVAPDGIWGPVTESTLNWYSEAQQVMLIIAARQEFMTSLSTWNTFGKGWINRMSKNIKVAAREDILDASA